ncbi:asparaginase [Tomitella gaofuii]|uniref:asparaginase n=1 Tax=Tomitella gaofuii TaxID=2760083 RepID=UPI0015F7A303|nr:asparaginase [Tomitella gaofuii]
MARIVVLATGGTIASAYVPGGGSAAQRGVADLLAGAPGGPAIVEGKDVMNLGSYLLTHRDLRRIAEAAAAELARDDVDGVVITHGTDTMEETAYLLDLVHSADKPVVFTGAQRAADEPDTDGPRNLRDAIAVAASPRARGRGVLLVFAGRILPAARTRKTATIAPDPFAALGAGPVGSIVDGNVAFTAAPLRPSPLALPDARFDVTRVDVVVAHPGADARLASAAVDAGARGVILAGTGAGNGNHALLEWVRTATADGITVGLSTRVHEGPVVPIYANGGGVDLVAAGALCTGSLPLFHARILFAALLAGGRHVDGDAIADHV